MAPSPISRSIRSPRSRRQSALATTAATRAPERPRRSASVFLALVGLVASLTLAVAAPAQAVNYTSNISAGGAYTAPGNVFFAYVKAGEWIHVWGGTANAMQIIAPTGTTYSGLGTSSTIRTARQATATTAGVWTVNGGNGGLWSVSVFDKDPGYGAAGNPITTPPPTGATEITGRVWTEKYSIIQSGAGRDIRFWMLNDNGYQYALRLLNYMGVNSTIEANSLGVPQGTSGGLQCTPSYRSWDANASTPPMDCATPYRLFFQQPAADLPVTAPIAPTTFNDNKTVQVIKPAPVDVNSLTVDDFSFTPDAPGSAAGTFGYDLGGFIGAHYLRIDVDNNGVFTDPVDRMILVGAQGAPVSYHFDGVDGLGNAIASCQPLSAQIYFDRVGEVHVVQTDVEQRAGGIEIIRENGPGSPTPTIYWDDRQTGPRSSTTPILDGTAGVNSTGAVHGWPNGGNNNGWGNNKIIDDWSYVPVDRAMAVLAVPGQCLEVTKTSDADESVQVGDVVHYTVTATNTGTEDFTAADPAHLVDDLAGVIDDADYQGDAAATVNGSPAGTVTTSLPRLQWSGPLAVGDSVKLTYSVEVTGDGDRTARNVVFAVSPGGSPNDPTPACTAGGGSDPDAGVFCAATTWEMPRLIVEKTASRSSLPAAGESVTYTVTGTNTGPGPYTEDRPAVVIDDLTGVLDDGTVVAGSLHANVPGDLALDGDRIVWSGALLPNQSVIITYEVEYSGAGDHVLRNVAFGSNDPGEPTPACDPRTAEGLDPATGLPCDVNQIPGSGLSVVKSVDPASGASVGEGDALTYTLTFTNNGTADATVDHVDHLAALLDDATVGAPTSTDLTVSAISGGSFTITGTVPAGESATVTYTATVRPADERGDSVLANFLVADGVTPPASCEPSSESCTVNYAPTLGLEKTSDATADTRPGDVVNYTVTLTNTGVGAFTTATPARMVDDLGAVLDDATYNNDAVATVDGGAVTAPTYAAPRVRWEGPLAAGKSVVIEYSVTVKGGGDGTSTNVAWVPQGPTPGPTPDCNDPATTVPCATSEFLLPKLTVTKTASRNDLPSVGGQITYTVTVKNEGPGPWTTAEPGVVDDLSDVEDDATMVAAPSASSGVAAYDNGQAELTWSGALAPSASATITYTFQYDGDGDQSLVNAACVPAEDALDPQDDCRTTTTPGSGLEQAKTSNPPSGTAVDSGDEITYTLRFSNTGPAPATVDAFDDVSGVVDDATLSPLSTDAGLTAVLDPNGGQPRIHVTGTVPPGQTLRVTYSATVKDAGDRGDDVLRNSLACSAGAPAGCEPETTEHPVRALQITKTSDATADTRQGDTVTYTVTAENIGGDYTAADPAVVVDDLSGVLDDGDYNEDATAEIGGTGVVDPAYLEPRLTWTGPLASGETVTITYTVTLGAGGDGVVRNTAWAPETDGPVGPTPDCDDPTTAVPCAEVEYELPRLSISKTADKSEVNATGEVVTYTVVVTNEGPGDYTPSAPATFVDDLTDVLDDTTYVAGSETADVGTPTFADPELSWTGVLAAGDDATVSYQVRYTGAGDQSLVNAACVFEHEAQDPAAACDTVSVPGSGLVHRKSVDPASGTAVEVGQVLTYTLTFDNTAGQAAATVNTTDDLSQVLDDATFDDASITVGTGLDAARVGNTLSVTGTVPAGAARTVTYQVTVKPFADQGDHVITNALQCDPGEPTPCAPETVTNPVRHVVLTKVKTAPAEPDTGDQVTYTLSVHNDGAGDWTAADPASVVDDLSGVLDDATWDGTQQASAGSLSYAAPELTWTGALTHGDTVTITYSVTVTNTGDHRLANTASVTGCTLTECNPPVVVTPLPHVVPSKTSTPADGQAVQPGDVITYTLRWENDGPADGVVDSTDDLSGVLDDAVVVAEPTSSSGAVTATRTGNTLRVVGPVPAGDTVTVTYQVRVEPSGQHGDNRLANVLAQDTPQVDCTPLPCTPVPPPTTNHPVGDLDDWKTVDPATGTSVKQGARLTYTLHFTNTGTGPVTVNRVDDLSGVLDDAVLVTGPSSSSGALSAAAPAAGRLAVIGTLAPGASATVTYTVQVKKDGQRGDSQLGNYLLDPGQQPPASCSVAMRADTPRADCTANQVGTTRFNLKLDKKVVSSTRVLPGDTVRYRLQVANRGPDAAPGPIVLKDPLPAGLELLSAKGRGWGCKAKQASDKVVCTYDGDIAAGKKAPSVTVVAKVTKSAHGRVVNVATVSAVGDTVKSDNKGSAPIQVSAVPALPGTGFRIGLADLFRF